MPHPDAPRRADRDVSLPTVCAVIPARAGSKGLPGKNLALLAGLPLVVHTVRAARSSRLLTRTVVTTDDPAVAAACEAEGQPVPWLRPAALASDAARVQAAVRDALEREPAARACDYLLLLQPTTPLRSAADIDACIRLAGEHGATSVVSFTPAETHHPWYMYRYDASGRGQVTPFAEYPAGLPRQAFPPCVYRNGAIYLVRRAYFEATDRFDSPDAVPYLMPAERSVNIDTPLDLRLAELLLADGEGT